MARQWRALCALFLLTGSLHRATSQAQWEWEFFDWRPEDYEFPKIFAERLTEANFKSKLLGWRNAEKEFSVIDFYAPWCPHCQHFAPHYERVAEAFNNRSKLEVATVDCTTERKLCSLFNIRYYPSLLFTTTQGWIDAYRRAEAGTLTDLRSMGITDLLYDVKLEHTAKALGTWLSEAIGDHVGLAQTDRSALFTVKYFSTQMRNIYASSGSFKMGGPWLTQGPKDHADHWDVLVATALSLHYAFEVQTGDPQLRESLEDWVEVLCHNFPIKSLRPRLCDLRILKMDSFLNVTGTRASDAMEHGWKLGMDKEAVRPGSPAYELPWKVFKHGWRSCRGTWPGTRGYTCGLWLLFHSLVMGADTDNAAVDALLRIRTYVKDYFGCKDCQDNFLKQRVEPCTFQLSTDNQNKWLQTKNVGDHQRTLQWTDPAAQGTWFKLELEEMRNDARKVFKIKMAFPLGGEFDDVEVPLYLTVGGARSDSELIWTEYEVQAAVFAMAPAVAVAPSRPGQDAADTSDMSRVNPNKFRLMYMATFQDSIEDGAFLSRDLKPTLNGAEAAVLEMTCYDGAPAQPFMTGVKTKRDVHLWLWRAHNEVNKMVMDMSNEASSNNYVYADPDFPHPQWPNVTNECKSCKANTETNQGLAEVAGKGFKHSWDLEYVSKYLYKYYKSTMAFAPPFTDRFTSKEIEMPKHYKRVKRKTPKPAAPQTSSGSSASSSSSSSSSATSGGGSSSDSDNGMISSGSGSGRSSSRLKADEAYTSRPAPVQLPTSAARPVAAVRSRPVQLPAALTHPQSSAGRAMPSPNDADTKPFVHAAWATRPGHGQQPSMVMVYFGDSAVLGTLVVVVGLLGGAVYTAVSRDWLPSFSHALELRPLKSSDGAFGSGGL